MDRAATMQLKCGVVHRKVPTLSLHNRLAASLLRFSIEVRLFPPPRGMVSKLKRPAHCFFLFFFLSGRVTGLTLEKDQQAAHTHTHLPPVANLLSAVNTLYHLFHMHGDAVFSFINPPK